MRLKETVFENCSLKEVDFSNADLAKASFSDSDLTNANFENTNLIRTDFRGANGITINPCVNKIKGAIFSKENVINLLSNFQIKIE